MHSAFSFAARISLVAVLGPLAASSGAANAAEPAPDQAPAAKAERAAAAAIDPRAIDLLKAMSARLAAARALSFTALTTYESPSTLGAPLAYTTVSEVRVARPNRLSVVTAGDGPATEIYDDGKAILAYAPAENLVAIADAPPTVDAALRLLDESAATYLPFTDVIVADPYGDIAGSIEAAFVVGQSKVVGGTTTDIVAAAVGPAFLQIWIGAEDRLPRRIRAVFAHDPSLLRHDLELSSWRIDGEMPDEAFTSAKAAAARRIPFERPDPKLPPEVKISPSKKPPAANKSQGGGQ